MGLEVEEADVLAMQERFEGTMDLTSLDDCHAMMAILLRNVDTTRAEYLVLRHGVEDVCRAVLTDDENVRALAKKMLNGGTTTSVFATAYDIAMATKRIMGLTDEQVAEEALKSVADIAGFADKAVAVEELASRFMSMKEKESGKV